jgi:hypothetical protein
MVTPATPLSAVPFAVCKRRRTLEVLCGCAHSSVCWCWKVQLVGEARACRCGANSGPPPPPPPPPPYVNVRVDSSNFQMYVISHSQRLRLGWWVGRGVAVGREQYHACSLAEVWVSQRLLRRKAVIMVVSEGPSQTTACLNHLAHVSSSIPPVNLLYAWRVGETHKRTHGTHVHQQPLKQVHNLCIPCSASTQLDAHFREEGAHVLRL